MRGGEGEFVRIYIYVRRMSQHLLRRQYPLLLCDEGVHDAVYGDGLAVAELEALVRLERAAERVPKVHRAEERLLPKVGADALEHSVDRQLDHLWLCVCAW